MRFSPHFGCMYFASSGTLRISSLRILAIICRISHWARVQSQIADVQQLGEVDHDLEVGGRGIGQDEARVLGGDAGGYRLAVDAGDLAHQPLELVRPARIAPAL